MKLNQLVVVLRALSGDDKSPFKLEGPCAAGMGDLHYPTTETVERTELYDAWASVGCTTVHVTIRRPYVTAKDDRTFATITPPTIDEVVDELQREAVQLATKKLFERNQEVQRLVAALRANGVSVLT